MKLPLEIVEREITRLWEEESLRSRAPRLELMTVVAAVSDLALLERAKTTLADFARRHPARTILTIAVPDGDAAITAEASLHRRSTDGPACGDAIVLEATGAGREWLPENVDRLALPDLPICLWWVGDLPDFDRLFERMLGCADMVVVNSGDMDLRDLEKLADIAARSRERFALSDLTWIRLRVLQELVARFFDDEGSLACLAMIQRIRIVFAPREHETDVASTQAGLLFGWIANALALHTTAVQWTRGDGWSEANLDGVVARFEPRARTDVPAGTILSVSIECADSRFEIERQADPQLFRWSRDVPGVATPTQTLRVAIHDESSLFARCLERPKRDRLLEMSLQVASRAVRAVAPRLSGPPKPNV